MRPENRALLVTAVAVVVLAAVGGAYFFLKASPASLPIPTGTVIDRDGYSVSFTVAGGVGRLVGAWYANQGGVVSIAWSNYSWPVGPHFPCFTTGPWNETVNVPLVPGTYTMAFGRSPPGWTFAGPWNGTFVVTQAIHLVYFGESFGTNSTLLANWCVP